jgi:hypothetical protein
VSEMPSAATAPLHRSQSRPTVELVGVTFVRRGACLPGDAQVWASSPRNYDTQANKQHEAKRSKTTAPLFAREQRQQEEHECKRQQRHKREQ